jgi:hypothetical protein
MCSSSRSCCHEEEFSVQHGKLPADYFVWLDQSSADDHTNQRPHEWPALGRACVRRATFIRGQRFPVLPALTSDGIIALDIFEGSVTKEKFIRFTKEELVCFLGSCLFITQLISYRPDQLLAGAELRYIGLQIHRISVRLSKRFTRSNHGFDDMKPKPFRPEVRPWFIEQ